MSNSGQKRSPRNLGTSKKPTLFSWSSFPKKKSGRKTVPIVEKPANSKREFKSDSKIVEEIEEVDEEFAGTHQIDRKIDRQWANHGIGRIELEIQIVESPKSQDALISVQSERWGKSAPVIHKTCSQPSLSENPVRSTSYPPRGLGIPEKQRGIYKKPSSKPGSPDKPQVRSPGRRRKPAQVHGISRLSGKKTEQETNTSAGNYGPVTGMSVLVVTLGVMLLLGRVYAIIFTSACFYFVPWLRTGEKMGEVAGTEPALVVDVDLNSAEYKKRVILEGLLERKQRNQ